MSGKKPLFISAPRLIIGIRNSKNEFKKIGYAIGLNINVSTTVVPIQVLGDFAPIGYEPTQYQPVSGSFQIIRLQSLAQRTTRKSNSQLLYKDSKTVNPALIDTTVSTVADTGGNNVLYENNIWDHLDPTKILTSSTFDIEVYLNYTGYGHDVSSTEAQTLVSALDATPAANKIIGSTANVSLVKFMVLHDCRLTSRNVNIAQGQLVNEPLNFQGLLAQQRFDTDNTLRRNEALDSIIKEGV